MLYHRGGAGFNTGPPSRRTGEVLQDVTEEWTQRHPGSIRVIAVFEDETERDLPITTKLIMAGQDHLQVEWPDDLINLVLSHVKIISLGYDQARIHIPRWEGRYMTTEGTPRRGYRSSDEHHEMIIKATRYYGETVTDQILRDQKAYIARYQADLEKDKQVRRERRAQRQAEKEAAETED